MGTNKIIYLDKEFSATDVTSGNLYQARSPIAASQEIDTFGFDIDSDDTTLTDFIRNTPLTFFHDDEQMGIFYVQKISRTSIISPALRPSVCLTRPIMTAAFTQARR